MKPVKNLINFRNKVVRLKMEIKSCALIEEKSATPAQLDEVNKDFEIIVTKLDKIIKDAKRR